MARRWCNFIVESAYKTAATSTFDGTTNNTLWLPVELSADNAARFNWDPTLVPVRTALARNRVEKNHGRTMRLTGAVQTRLYPAQDNLLLGWGFTRVDQGSAGTSDDLPWTTSEPARDLASAMFVGFMEDDSLTVERYRFNGCKCQGMTLTMDRNTDDGDAMLSFDFVGSERASSSDTEPAKSLYPSTAPYNLADCTLEVNSNTLQNYQSVSVNVANELTPMIDNRSYAQPIRCYGRVITIQITQLYKASPDLQALWTGRTEFPVVLTLTHPTTPTVEFDFQTKCRVTAYERGTPLGDRHTETYTITAMYDRTNGTELVLTFT